MSVISSGTLIVSGVTSSNLEIVEEGILCILDGGLAFRTGVSDGGTVNVSSGGILFLCTVESGGTVTALNNGYAQDVTVDGGVYHVSKGATAHHSIIQSGGVQYLYDDGFGASACVMEGGILHVQANGLASAAVVSQGGTLYLWSRGLVTAARIVGALELDTGGILSSSTVFGGGRINVRTGGAGYDTTVNEGSVQISSGGSMIRMVVNSGGTLNVQTGGTATTVRENGGYVGIEEGAEVMFVSNTVPDLALSDASATIHFGTTATDTTVNAGGKLEVFSGGTATEVLENGGYVEITEGASVTFASNTISGLELADSATVHSGTTATNTTVNSGGKLEVFSGGTANSITVNSGGQTEVSSGVISGAVVNSGGSLLIYDGTRITGHMMFTSGAVVIPFVGSILNFDLTQTEAGAEALVNDLSILMGTPSYTLTVVDAQAEGMYTLAEGATRFKSTITVQNALGETFGTLSVGEMLDVDGLDYTLNLTDSALSITVKRPVLPPTNLVGTKDRVSWDPVGTDGYAVEYSTDGFAHCLAVKVSSNAADMLEFPAGTYQWRVKSEDGEDWAVGDEIVSDNDNTPKVLQSNADGYDDLFFATANGTWENIYYAQHVGSVNDWKGTNDFISANGKGRIQNLFFGSSDPNVLCLTDGENGDAIFLDDVYTELPEEIEANTARLLQIQEIRAGAGDDIVDMTSQRFEYVGEGLTIRGGAGNDTIWANKGENFLFGDAGNDRIVGASGDDVIVGGIGSDRMHGGGGNDVFTFCENWGTDTVEQLEFGSVTLWFVSGNESNWNAETLTYTDGKNSVAVSGIDVDRITLKFGENSPEDTARFASLSGMGAFDAFTSRKIFEESNGMLV